MTNRIYSIYDRDAEEYGPLYEARNDAVAIRNFRTLLSKTDYKDSLQLFFLGTSDTSTGVLVPVGRPVQVPLSLVEDLSAVERK